MNSLMSLSGHFCGACQRAKGLHGHRKRQSQKKSSVIRFDHFFYKVSRIFSDSQGH